MRFRTSPAFREERARYALQFTCEQCAHFDQPRLACAHGYPVADHLEASQSEGEGDLVFCKEFELR